MGTVCLNPLWMQTYSVHICDSTIRWNVVKQCFKKFLYPSSFKAQGTSFVPQSNQYYLSMRNSMVLRAVVKAHKKKRGIHIQFLKVEGPKQSKVPVHSRDHTVPACTHDLLFQIFKVTET